MLSIGSYMRFSSILLYTFPAMGVRLVSLQPFICFEASLRMGMTTLSHHCLGVSFCFRTVFVISRNSECKVSPKYFIASVVIASSELGDLFFFLDFIAFIRFFLFFVKLYIFISRSSRDFGIFDVSTGSLKLFKSSQKRFSHSFIDSSLFAAESPFLLFTFVALLAVNFPVVSLTMENTLDDCFCVAVSMASTYFCC